MVTLTLIETLFNDMLTTSVAESNLVCLKFKSGIEYLGKLKYLDKGTYELNFVLEAAIPSDFTTVVLRPACLTNADSKLYFSVSDLLGVVPITESVNALYNNIAPDIFEGFKCYQRT